MKYQCNASFHQERESVLPRQQSSSNSTVLTLTLNNLAKLNKTRGNTRFIFELYSLTAHQSESTTCVKAEKYIDDEFTPAVFKTIIVNSTGTGGTAYSAWKPVAYIDKKRSLEEQVPSYAYYRNSHHFISSHCDSLPYSPYHPSSFSIAYHLEKYKFLSYGMNISFGRQKDGWYDGKEAKRYLSWSAVVGYGRPLSDHFSPVVLIIIIVGFGAPLLLIFVTVVYIIVKRFKAKKAASSYGIIN